MAEEEATPAEENAENAEATEATEATADAAAEAPAEEEAPKQQSVWLPILASSVISIVGAFALFQFVLGPKLVKGLAMALDSNGTLHASHGEGGEDDNKEHAAGGESGGGSHEPKEEGAAGTNPGEDDSKGAISIVGEGESIVINPANSGGSRYLLVDIYLVRKNEEDKTFKGAIDANSKKLQSLTMDKLSEHDINQLSNPLIRKQIENNLLNQYQRVLGEKEHPIKELVVTRWIMQ